MSNDEGPESGGLANQREEEITMDSETPTPTTQAPKNNVALGALAFDLTLAALCDRHERFPEFVWRQIEDGMRLALAALMLHPESRQWLHDNIASSYAKREMEKLS